MQRNVIFVNRCFLAHLRWNRKGTEVLFIALSTGLLIRIHFLRILIQLFFSMRIRIQLKQIFTKITKFTLKILIKCQLSPIHMHFFSFFFLKCFPPGSGSRRENWCGSESTALVINIIFLIYHFVMFRPPAGPTVLDTEPQYRVSTPTWGASTHNYRSLSNSATNLQLPAEHGSKYKTPAAATSNSAPPLQHQTLNCRSLQLYQQPLLSASRFGLTPHSSSLNSQLKKCFNFYISSFSSQLLEFALLASHEQHQIAANV